MADFNLRRMRELPGLLKPVLFAVLLVYLILMAASYYDPGWWIWLTLIIQFIVIIIVTFMVLFGIEKIVVTKRIWTIAEMVYSAIFVILNIANTVVQMVLLIRRHSSLFGVGALICFGLVLLYGLDCLMMFRIWRQDVISSQSPGSGVRPGDPGNMNPGLGAASGAYPATAAPTTNTSYPPAIPPGATFPSTTTQ